MSLKRREPTVVGSSLKVCVCVFVACVVGFVCLGVTNLKCQQRRHLRYHPCLGRGWRRATKAIHVAVEIHSKRLFRDGNASATMIRKRQTLAPNDLKTSMARGAQGDLSTHLRASEERIALPPAFVRFTPHLIKKISGSEIGTGKISAAARECLPMALHKFMTKVTQRAMQEAVRAKRKRVSELDVVTALSACCRTLM